MTAAEPTMNTPVLAPSVAAPHSGVPGSRSGSKSSARHQNVKLMHNYPIVINRSKLKFIFTLAILNSVLGLCAELV